MNTKLSQIGNTPLIQFSGHVSNGNRIWFKLECENPFGSHYDRVYIKLFEYFEKKGLLTPGCEVLETTSGSAGVSFAAVGKLLGYKCLVAIPEGGERAREKAILDQGAELIYTPANQYVSGFPTFVKRFLVERRRSGNPVVFLNHSMGPKGTENTVAVSALAEIGEELLIQLNPIDYFVAAVGNGSSILGPSRVLKGKTEVLTFEPFQSAVAHGLMHPGQYEATYGIKPGSLSRHSLPGTSFQGIDFPHIRLAFQDERLVDETVLVSDAKTDREYHQITGNMSTQNLPHWDMYDIPYGRTTRAGLAVALAKAKKVKDKNLVVLAYDKPDRYDN